MLLGDERLETRAQGGVENLTGELCFEEICEQVERCDLAICVAEQCYPVVEAEPAFDLYCHYEQGKDDTVACYLMRSGRIQARFTGDGLRDWFERHVERRGEQPGQAQ